MREGETIQLRLRVGDNRRLDDPELKPQEAVYPPSGWTLVRVDSAAPPADEQEILTKRDVVREFLLAALDQTRFARGQGEIVRKDAAGRPNLSFDQTVRLDDAREHARAAAALLRTVATEAALAPELRPLAAAAREVADTPLKSAENSLRAAATDNPAERGTALTAAAGTLDAAAARVDQLLDFNDRFSRARLDRLPIAALAEEQAALANLAKPAGVTPPAELARLQRELVARYRKLLADSDTLRVAADAATQKEIRQFVATATELAGLIRDLDAAAKRLELDARQLLFRQVAGEQGMLVSLATVLFAKAETAARLAGTDLPKIVQFTRVADLLGEGKTVAALTEMEERAQNLDAIAATLEKWAADYRDPKAAARKLALWQEDLRGRFRTATKNNAASFETLPEATKIAFQREQIAVRLAVMVLRMPPDEELRKLHTTALANTGNASVLLNKTGATADVAMQQAIDGFNRLAERIPTIPERIAKVRLDYLKLQQGQDAIFFAVEQAVRGGDAAKKLPALVDQQVNQVGAFRALDLPGHQARVNCIAVALASATADLRDGLPVDALASQYWVKRELDRLKNVLDGVPAPDDRAAEFAGKLDSLAKALEVLGPSPAEKPLAVLAAESLETARQLGVLGIFPEAPSLSNEARVAALYLEVAAREQKVKPEELFVDRLYGAEPDFDRVRRLAGYRWAALREAEKNQGKPANPDASAEAARQLGREVDELTHTRVGVCGQAIKKKALEQYARLKEQTAPDRQGGPLRALAESLDELAGVMADAEWLVTPINRTPKPPTPTDADNYLPTPALAESFRDLARQQRALRLRVTDATAEVVKLTRPAEKNPLAELERRQRQLAAEILAFARQLEADKEPAAAELALGAAVNATLAADGLAVGLALPASGSGDLAGQALRRVASTGGTKPLAKTAADLAARQDVIRSGLPLRHPDPGVAAAQQKARGEELARRSAELVRQLEFAVQAGGPKESRGPALLEAAKEVKAAEKLIAEATRRAAATGPSAGATSRAEAVDHLTAGAKKLEAGLPPMAVTPDLDTAAANAADLLRRAEVAMRQALAELEPKADRVAAGNAMRTAAGALANAAKARVEITLERK
jgi:hypothetical protein